MTSAPARIIRFAAMAATFLAGASAQAGSGPGGVAGRGSEAIYPPTRSSLRFSHPLHKKINCSSCHGQVKASVSTTDRNLPREAACRPCHKEKTRGVGSSKSRKRSSGGCRYCHSGFSGKGSPLRAVYPPANLRFGHRIHLEKGARCGDCHDFAKGAMPMPSMARCRACHERRGVSNRCAACHLTGKDGRLRTSFSSGKLLPRGTLQGAAHGPLFSKDHAVVARKKKRFCDSCHRPATCLRCHAGSLRPMSIHSGDYVQRHAMDARRDQPRCSSCHRSQSFCLSCHQRLGVGRETKGSGFAPHTAQSFHPPGFSGYQRGPGHHSNSARRNIRTCSSCHGESTCLRCHGGKASGKAGFSPHAPGFGGSKKCRSLSARNRRVCLKCHQSGDSNIDCR